MATQAYQHILIALDVFSEYQQILERGLALVDSPSKVSLIHVTVPEVFFEPSGMAIPTDIVSQVQEQARDKLMTLADAHNIAKDKIHMPVGSPAEEIHDLADDLQVDLIVIGTHGQSGLKLLLGSTANAVLHGSKCDVLAVRV